MARDIYAPKQQRTPRNVSPKRPIAPPKLKALDWRRVGTRIKEALTEAGMHYGADTNSRRAELLRVDKKTFERWCAGDNRPRTEQLYMIGQLTGDSVDWLLGFDDISQRRLDRAPVAHVGDDLRRILEQTASDIQTEESALIKAIAERDSVPLPVPRWRKRLNPLPESPSDLVALLAKGWWDREIMTQAVRWRDTLRELAAKMRADSASAEEAYLQEVLLRTSDRIYYDADHLDSTDAFLRKVDALESEGPLPNVNRPTSLDSIGVAFSLTLETDFPVLANRLNYGVAYRGKKRDRVWYIDTDLHVSVREHGRCLVERKKEPGLLSNLLRNVGINAADGPLYRTSSPKVGPQSIQSLLEGAAGSATPVTPASTEMLNTAPKRKRAGTSTKAPRTQRYKLTAVPSKKRNKGRDRT